MAPARQHLFELNDSPWVPCALRETIIESLGRTLEWGRLLSGVVPAFRQFLAQCGTSEVLELCAGSGVAAGIFARVLALTPGAAVRVLMTDLFPHPQAWAKQRDAHPGVLDFVDGPIDAAQIPEAVGAGRARLMINSLHHFRPEQAGAILRGAARDAPGIFIVEGFERTLLGFLPFILAGLPALLLNPLLAPERRLQKALLTWLSPVALLAALWDGLVSTRRVYTEAELRELVAPLGAGWTWTFGTYRFPLLGQGTYFHGLRSPAA